MFGIRSDGEDEKTTLSSLVLDTKITAPVVAPPLVGLSQRDRVPTAPPPPEHHSSEEVSKTLPLLLIFTFSAIPFDFNLLFGLIWGP